MLFGVPGSSFHLNTIARLASDPGSCLVFCPRPRELPRFAPDPNSCYVLAPLTQGAATYFPQTRAAETYFAPDPGNCHARICPIEKGAATFCPRLWELLRTCPIDPGSCHVFSPDPCSWNVFCPRPRELPCTYLPHWPGSSHVIRRPPNWSATEEIWYFLIYI